MILTRGLLLIFISVFYFTNYFIERNKLWTIDKILHLSLVKSRLTFFLIGFESLKLNETRHFKHRVIVLELVDVLKVTIKKAYALSVAIYDVKFFILDWINDWVFLLILFSLIWRFDCIDHHNSITLSIENLKDLFLLYDCFSFSNEAL